MLAALLVVAFFGALGAFCLLCTECIRCLKRLYHRIAGR